MLQNQRGRQIETNEDKRKARFLYAGIIYISMFSKDMASPGQRDIFYIDSYKLQMMLNLKRKRKNACKE